MKITVKGATESTQSIDIANTFLTMLKSSTSFSQLQNSVESKLNSIFCDSLDCLGERPYFWTLVSLDENVHFLAIMGINKQSLEEELLEASIQYRTMPERICDLVENIIATKYTDYFTMLDFSDNDLLELTEHHLELIFSEIRTKFIQVIESYISSKNLNSSSTASSIPSRSTNDLIREMKTKGGPVTVNNVSGLVVNVYYDYNASKLRVQTNDGVHGLANVAFPNSARFTDAVYIVPESYVGWNGKNYRISNSTPLNKFRIR